MMRSTMSTTTFDLHDSTSVSASSGIRKPGFWARLIAARAQHGQARVSHFLAGKSDEALAELGFKPEQIAAIRTTGQIPASFWR